MDLTIFVFSHLHDYLMGHFASSKSTLPYLLKCEANPDISFIDDDLTSFCKYLTNLPQCPLKESSRQYGSPSPYVKSYITSFEAHCPYVFLTSGDAVSITVPLMNSLKQFPIHGLRLPPATITLVIRSQYLLEF